MTAELSTLAAHLREALAADPHRLGGLLADDVRWLGARGGACRGRDEVLAGAAAYDLSGLDSAPAASTGEPVPPARVVDLVPFVPVADVARSVAFYRMLGRELLRA